MLYLVLLGLGLAALSASEQQCAKAGGRPQIGRNAALKRLPSHMRAQAEQNMRARSSGIGRVARPASAGSLPQRAQHPLQRAGVRCGPMPWLSERVNESALHFINEHMDDEREVTTEVLREVYPVTNEGQDIAWPSVPGDCAAIRALEERTRLRVAFLLAKVRDMEADQIYHE